MGGATGPARAGLVRVWDSRFAETLEFADRSVTSTCARALTSPIWPLRSDRLPRSRHVLQLLLVQRVCHGARQLPALLRKFDICQAFAHCFTSLRFGFRVWSLLRLGRNDELKGSSSQPPG